MEGFANACDLSENQAPVSEAGLDQTTSYNQVVTLDGSGSSDPDGTIESYEWSQISGANVILSSNDQLTTTFTSPNEEGELVLGASFLQMTHFLSSSSSFLHRRRRYRRMIGDPRQHSAHYLSLCLSLLPLTNCDHLFISSYARGKKIIWG